MPQSARLSAGGGCVCVQLLFGQCPNRMDMNFKGVFLWDPQVCKHRKICLYCCRHLRHQRHHRRHHDRRHLLNDKGESGGELLLHLSQLEVLLRALQVGGRPTLIMLIMIVVTMLVLMMTMLVLMMTCAILGTRLAMLKMSSKIEVTCVTVLNSLQFLVVKYFRD